jgi:hypothetical protein
MLPDVPVEADPVESARAPLAVVLDAVESDISPLAVLEAPEPVEINTKPPVLPEEAPAAMVTLPP